MNHVLNVTPKKQVQGDKIRVLEAHIISPFILINQFVNLCAGMQLGAAWNITGIPVSYSMPPIW
jgi:hypothetical protein